MKVTVNQYAKGLYELTAGKSKPEVDGIVASFIKVLQKNRQLKLADRIITKFKEISNQENGIVEAEITSREKLSGETIKKLNSFVKEKYQAKEVILNNKIDLNIQGGIVIKVGDEVLDGSVARQLHNLRGSLEK